MTKFLKSKILLAAIIIFGVFGMARVSLAADITLPLKLDFNDSQDKTQPGHIGFRPLIYDSLKGYGWDVAPTAYCVWNYDFKNLTRDMHLSDNDKTFMVDLPNGDYTVKMFFRGSVSGSATYADNFQVKSEGLLALDNLSSTPYPNVKTFDTTVADNKLHLLFHDNGGANNKWMINGLEISNKIIKPTISSIQADSLIKGSAINISGQNFGIKNIAAPLKWDDFESGINGVPVSSLSDWATWGTGIHQPVYKVGIINREGSTLCSEHKMGPGDYGVRNSRLKWWTNQNTDKLYVSFWTRFNFGRNIVDDDNSYQLKFWRLSNTEISNWDGDMDIGASNWRYDRDQPNQSQSHYYFVRTGGGSGDWSDYYTPKLEEDKWFRIEMEVKQSDVGVANGGFNVWHSRNSGPIIRIINNWDVLTRKISSKLKAISLGEWLGNLTDGETENYYDDVYFDNSWARLELGDTPDFSTNTHREIQIPTAWSDNSITFTLNQGSFNNSEDVYLFVVDENGNASSGYPITLGGLAAADIISPLAPSGVAVN